MRVLPKKISAGRVTVQPRCHGSEKRSHGLPTVWIEEREKVAFLSINEERSLGVVFDSVIARMLGQVVRNKSKFRGVPCLKQSRIPLYQICGMMSEGLSAKKIARELAISENEVKAALRFASMLLEQ